MELETAAMDKEEVENIVVDLREDGKSTSEIGIILRDQYGVPDAKQALGKKISALLEEKDLNPPVPEDLQNVLDKAENIRSHLEDNPNDAFAKRGLARLEARIRKLGQYYKGSGKLSDDWSYRPGETKEL